MLLVIVKANLYGDNSFTTNGNFLVSNYGVKYNLLLTVNNIEILFKFKRGTYSLFPMTDPKKTWLEFLRFVIKGLYTSLICLAYTYVNANIVFNSKFAKHIAQFEAIIITFRPNISKKILNIIFIKSYWEILYQKVD